MLIYLDHALAERRAEIARDGGAVERVRRKMMTVVAIMTGLMPILWAHGTNFELSSLIAVPVIGCMVSITVLALVVIPTVYALIKVRKLAKAEINTTERGLVLGRRDILILIRIEERPRKGHASVRFNFRVGPIVNVISPQREPPVRARRGLL